MVIVRKETKKVYYMGQWENVEDVFPYCVHSPSNTIESHQEKWRWLVQEHNLQFSEDFVILNTHDTKSYDAWWFNDAQTAILFGLKWGTQNDDGNN